MLNDYQNFVLSTTSKPSLDYTTLTERMFDIESKYPVNIPLLLTASIGLSSETGEFNEIVKKILFQGKEFNEAERYHMKRELGDVLWYLTNAASALGYDLEDIVVTNISKLEKRYPNGFEVSKSENRVAGDI